jgi:hypothetical protein
MERMPASQDWFWSQITWPHACHGGRCRLPFTQMKDFSFVPSSPTTLYNGSSSAVSLRATCFSAGIGHLLGLLPNPCLVGILFTSCSTDRWGGHGRKRSGYHFCSPSSQGLLHLGFHPDKLFWALNESIFSTELLSFDIDQIGISWNCCGLRHHPWVWGRNR